jgi:signal transduction histidine kinase
MKRNSLAWWLAATSVVLVTLVAAGMSWFSFQMLGRLAEDQQRASVQLAGADARAELSRINEDALTFSRVLAERPTLRRLLAEGDLGNLPSFLQRFCSTAHVDACAVFQGDTLLGAAGENVPWGNLLPIAREQGDRFLIAPVGSLQAYIGASSAVADAAPGTRVFAVDLLNDRMAARLGQQPGFTIRFRNYRDFNQAPEDAFTALHTAALADGRFAVAHLSRERVYAASHPVFSTTGEGIALIETRASTEAMDRELSRLKWRLLTIAAVLAGLALLAAVLFGRRITQPAEALTAAAVRLGQGDFSTSIPTGGPAEIGQLGRTMDDMRRNLIELTDTLRTREAEAQAVLGGIVEGVYAVDGERRIRYLNERAAQLLGIQASDAIGRFCGDVLKPRCTDGEMPCDHNCPILEARQKGSAAVVEYLRTPGGERRMVLTSARPVQELQVQVLRDETELEAVRRTRDTVFANISHEFRTPLAAQLASIELLREGLKSKSPAQLEELVLSLERGTLRLTRLIDNLLESVRIESGQLDIRRQSIDLHDVVEDAAALVESLLRQRSQQLQQNLEGDLTLQGDAVRLTQVFVNLLANAIKFAPASTSIRLNARREGKQLIAEVEDAGPGIPAGDREAVFERFGRGVIEPAPGGMGLGLAISRSIVERHGGRIAVSRTADEHTRFTISLPVEAAS